MPPLLSSLIVEPRIPPATRAVVWLHGLGADGHDFEPIVPELGLAPDLRVRFVFPHAPSIPVTINGGMVMPAWYDIRSADLGSRGDRAGVDRSAAHVRALLAREAELGIAPEHVVLAGFSQGAALALHVGLREESRLAGIVALSGYLLFPDALAAERAPANARTPVFAAHGRMDPVVPLAAGAASARALEALGQPVSWHEYPMAHQVCMEEIQAIGAFLNRVLR